MDVSKLYAAVAVSDIESATAWYERLLGRGPDRTPMPVDAEWDLSSGGGLQVVQTNDPGGSMLTISVTDIDAAVAEMRDRGVDIAPSPHEGQFWLSQVSDPDGNVITFAQPAG